jgi:hypothetical protein
MPDPRNRRGAPAVPPLVWGVLGFLVVAVFVLALGLLGPGA